MAKTAIRVPGHARPIHAPWFLTAQRTPRHHGTSGFCPHGPWPGRKNSTLQQQQQHVAKRTQQFSSRLGRGDSTHHGIPPPLAAAPRAAPRRAGRLSAGARAPSPLRATYGPVGESIEKKIAEELAPEVLVVNDDSEKHANHKGLHDGLSLIHISEPTRPY